MIQHFLEHNGQAYPQTKTAFDAADGFPRGDDFR